MKNNMYGCKLYNHQVNSRSDSKRNRIPKNIGYSYYFSIPLNKISKQNKIPKIISISLNKISTFITVYNYASSNSRSSSKHFSELPIYALNLRVKGVINEVPRGTLGETWRAVAFIGSLAEIFNNHGVVIYMCSCMCVSCGCLYFG